MFNLMLRMSKLLMRDPYKFFKRVHRFFRPMEKEYRKRFGINLRQWLLYHHKNIYKCHWMGIGAMKNPCDAWIYQEIIYNVKPDIIIEIGSFEGGTTLYFANLLDMLGKGIVISIDNDRTYYCVKHPRIVIITGDSSSAEVVAKVYELCKGKSVLIVHDGNHTKEHVLKDLSAYSDLVSINSYFIVEDGIIDLFSPNLINPNDGIGMFDDGPVVAIEEFLSKNPNFVVDSEQERYILTDNPKGFLKRVR